MSKIKSSKGPTKLRFERLDDRLCMAASVGWDGAGQGGAALTYYLGDTPSNLGLDRATIKATIEKALAVWAKVADVVFTETSRPGQAKSLDFDFRAIDGRGGTLAQAYFPSDANRSTIAGDVQFDSSEPWEIGNARGSAAFDLVWVAVHEIGHALGLEHSHTADSVMAASVSASQSFTALTASDVDAALRVYAPSKSGASVAPPTTPAQPSRPSSETETQTTPPATPTPPSTPNHRYFWGFRRYWRNPASWWRPLNWTLQLPTASARDFLPTTRIKWIYPSN
jgi:hypothetical protein